MKSLISSRKSNNLNLLAVGGGHGLSTLLCGLKRYVAAGEEEFVSLQKLSAVVAVSDDGGSSGRLRDELKMPPPGDIRSCMVALSEDSHLLSRLFQYRFSGSGNLGGHSFGNLFLAALSEITGDFAEAVKLSSEVLASKGHIYPATTTNVRLMAELQDGSVVNGETNISKVGSQIKRLKLEPEDCHPLPEVITAIYEADIITIGPGSLFTSLLPPLLVKGVAEAIAASFATKIFVCNLMTQPGETEGFSARKHMEVMHEYAPDIDFDYIVANNMPISEEQTARYAGEGSHQIGLPDLISSVTIEGAEIVHGNLLDEGEKVRHHPEKLAQIVLHCALQPPKLENEVAKKKHESFLLQSLLEA